MTKFKEIVKSGLVLALIAGVTTLALGLTNAFTQQAISNRQAETEAAVRRQVIDADTFEEVQGNGFTAHRAVKGGQPVGYVFTEVSTGKSSGLKVMVGLDTTGAVTGVMVTENNETAGYVDKVTEAGLLKAFVGKQSVEGVDTVSQATLTSKGIIKAVTTAQNKFKQLSGTAGDETDTFKQVIDAETFEQVQGDGFTAHRALKGGQPVGYVFSEDSTGKNSGLKVLVGLDTTGTVTGVKVTEDNESAGYVDKVTEAGLLDALVGKQSVEGVDAISQATLTSKGIINAVDAAQKKFQQLQGTGEGKTDTFKQVIDADTFEEVQGDGFTAHRALKGGQPVGYVFAEESTGKKSGLKVLVGLDTTGAVTGVIVTENNESAGYVDKVTEAGLLDALVGKQSVEGVDAISQATLTSNGIIQAVSAAQEKFKQMEAAGR